MTRTDARRIATLAVATAAAKSGSTSRAHARLNAEDNRPVSQAGRGLRADGIAIE